MSQLARKLHTIDYFTLGFGTMVGAGWLVLMSDWLDRGGPWGAMTGFLFGSLLLLPVGYVYGRLVMAIPDAGSEIAYAAKVFSPTVSFFAGWMMMLAYLVVCPWEGVAIGTLASYVFPGLNRFELYRIAGQPVFLPTLVLGLGLTALIVVLNYRGIRLSAAFQNWTTAGVLALFVFFAIFGLSRGSIHHTLPPFSHGGLLSVFLILQIVPYFMTGFESVPKCAEEASPEFQARGFFRAIMASFLVGAAFYCAIIFVVSYSWPWQELRKQPLATAYALRKATDATWIANLVLLAALLSLMKIFNGNFLASTRLLFALGRQGMIDVRFARLHPSNQTPWIAILAIGGMTAAGVCLGSSILVPVTEVGSMAAACGWLSACMAYFHLVKAIRQRTIAACGAAVSLALVAMKLFWFVPGSFSKWEWITLLFWVVAGIALRHRHTSPRQPAQASLAGH